MKILCTEYNEEKELAVIPIGDNALLRNNDDFYLPEFAKEISCVPQLVVRLSRLGKCVGERFASRYYEEIGLGVRFYADDFERELSEKNLPILMASSFDRSAAISGLKAKDKIEELHVSFLVNGELIYEEKEGGDIDGLISFASNYYTLKIGDFLYCGNGFRHRGLKLGDRIQMRLDGKEMMDFKLC